MKLQPWTFLCIAVILAQFCIVTDSTLAKSDKKTKKKKDAQTKVITTK